MRMSQDELLLAGILLNWQMPTSESWQRPLAESDRHAIAGRLHYPRADELREMVQSGEWASRIKKLIEDTARVDQGVDDSEETMGYRVLTSGSRGRLQREVQVFLAKGWQLVGGVAICIAPGNPDPLTDNLIIWGQAMIRSGGVDAQATEEV
jgi:hypothetical protein